MASIGQLREKLKLETKSSTAFNSVAMRIFLKTGVNIINPRDDADPIAIAKIRVSLIEMGFKYTVTTD